MLVAIPFGNGYFVNENGEVFSYKNDGLKKLKPITKEEVTGVKRANICKVLKGERRYAGGYEWGYAACGGELEVNNR